MPPAIDPNDIYQNGVYYNRNGLGSVPTFALDSVGNATGLTAPSGRVLPLGRLGAPTIAILGNSIVAQSGPQNNSGFSSWAESTAKTAGNTVIPRSFNFVGGYAHLQFVAAGSGTTSTREPIWPKVAGATVVDNNITWTAEARADQGYWGAGHWTLAQMLNGQIFDEVFMIGASGKQSAAIIAYVDEALTTNPDVVYFANVFENDCWPGVAPTLATVQASWNAVELKLNYVRSLGKTVMIQTLFPSGNIDGSSAFTTYAAGNGTAAWHFFNNKIREYCRTRGDVIFWDAASVYVDANPANPIWPENTVTYLSQTGSGQALKKTDGIHPYVSGHWLLAKSLSALLTSKFPLTTRFSQALNPCALSVNPLNFGTAGTAGTGITSGTPANLNTAIAYGTVTTSALTKVARTDIAGEFQRMTYIVTAADNANYNNITAMTLGAPFVAGQAMQGFGEIKIEANPTLLVFPQLYMRYNAGVALREWFSTSAGGTTLQDWGQFMTVDTLLTLKTLPVIMPVAAVNVIMYSKIYGRGAANFAVQFGRSAVVPMTVLNIA